jgi:hypothetical protein
MLSHTEDTRRFGRQTPPLKDVEVGKRPHKLWLVLGVALIAIATLFGWGVWSHVRARTALD